MESPDPKSRLQHVLSIQDHHAAHTVDIMFLLYVYIKSSHLPARTETSDMLPPKKTRVMNNES